MMDTTISPVDYIVFALSLIVCIVIGLYYGYRDRKNTSKDVYFVAGRNMNVYAVCCSTVVSIFSATVFLAFPNDAYFRGPGRWAGATISSICECFALALIYVPLYHRLKLTNIYDYLEMRFNVLVKYYSVLVQVMYTMLHMGLNIYAPSLAMSVISDVNINLSIIFVGGICVFYTTLGGMRAVVWTDVFQTAVILSGTIAILVIGISSVGGIGNVSQAMRDGNREVDIDFSTDLKLPYTFWSSIFALSVNGLTRSAVGQYIVQRYLSVKTVSEARLAAITGQVFSVIIYLAFLFAGLVMYTYYAGCDPFSIGAIGKQEELFPYWIKELFQEYPGFIGLLVAAMFSASISTVSSGINAQTVITQAEITRLLLKDPSPKKSMLMTKSISAVIGVICIFIGFLVTYIESIVDTVLTWSGILLGPVLGVFTVGMFSRRANSTGAFVGMICSTIVGMWLKLGNNGYPKLSSIGPPLFTDQCDITMMPVLNVSTVGYIADKDLEPIPVSLYQINGVYYGTIEFFLTIVISMLVSMCTGPIEPGTLNEDLFILPKGPYFSTIKKRVPGWMTKTGGEKASSDVNVELSEHQCDL